MAFGIFLDFTVRPGRKQRDASQESFALVDLADETGLDTNG